MLALPIIVFSMACVLQLPPIVVALQVH